jgi:hypothetical protein
MLNWIEAEEWAKTRFAHVERCMTDLERATLELLAERAAARKPLRARLASAMVRIGARIDPHTVVVHEDADEPLVEGRLAAYLR